MSKNPFQGYFYFIPAIVAESSLSDKAILLYGLITSLSDRNGYCTASNEYLASKLSRKKKKTKAGKSTINPRHIRRLCTELREAKFIDVVLLNKTFRKIYPQFTFRGRTKMS